MYILVCVDSFSAFLFFMPVSPSCKNRYNLLMIIPYFSAFVFTKELFFDIFKV